MPYLFSNLFSQLVTDHFILILKKFHYFGGFRRWKNADVVPCLAQVGTDPHLGYRNHGAVNGYMVVPAKEFGQFFLNQAGYFQLSCCFHLLVLLAG